MGSPRRRTPARGVARVPFPVLICGEEGLLPPEKGKHQAYFNELLTEVKTPLRLMPSPFTATMIASEMPAAIRPYSIAVAPASSDRNCKNLYFNAINIFSVIVAPAPAGIP